MEIISGKDFANGVLEGIKDDIDKLKTRGVTPKLSIVSAGIGLESDVFVRKKKEAGEKAGIIVDLYNFEKITTKEIVSFIEILNSKKEVHGILVQLPLPENLDKRKILCSISPEKDVDGLTPESLGKIMHGDESFAPATSKAIVHILEKKGQKPEGKHAVIVNHSALIGKPLSAMLLNRDCTVTVCNDKTKNLKNFTEKADMLITATGVPGLIKGSMLKEGAIVIDAGTKKTDSGILGDVDFESAKEKVSFITPVPGGVGPLTVAMLMKSVIMVAEIQTNK